MKKSFDPLAVPTMQDMADQLKLSRTTLSLIINGKALKQGIPARTIQRVEQHLRQRGYVPSRQAVALRTGQRSSVGILHCGQLYSHLTQAFNMFTDHYAVGPHGLEIMVVRREDLRAGLRELIARGVRQLIWIYHYDDPAEIAACELLPDKMPAVIYNFRFDENDAAECLARKGVYLVGVSRKKAYEKLARFLKELGHRTVLLPNVLSNRDPLDRQFIQAFSACDIQVVLPTIAKYPGNLMERGAVMTDFILQYKKSRGITAVCIRDDETAGYVMNGLIQQGVRVPQDLTITGFDGIPLGGVFRVPLTTLGVPVGAMVQRTVRLLADHPRDYCHCFDMDLIRRESHGRVAPGQ